jgi:hypothetical protein
VQFDPEIRIEWCMYRHSVARWALCFIWLALFVGAAFAADTDHIVVSFQGRTVRFAYSEKPYYKGSALMVSLRPVCAAMGASVKHSRDAIHWMIVRGSDRLEYALGEEWLVFNGAKHELPTRPEGRGDVLFVPFEFVDELSGGALEINWDGTGSRTPEVVYRGKPVRFRRDEQPIRIGGAIYLSVKATASATGIQIGKADRGAITLTRSLDSLTYELGQHAYLFNDAQKPLRNPSMVRGRTLYVSFELFHALLGDDLYCR